MDDAVPVELHPAPGTRCWSQARVFKFAIGNAEWLTREMQLPGNDDDLLKKTIEAGIDMSGSIGGAIAGVAVGGPTGGLAGAIAGTGLVHVLKDVAHRALSHRERQRVGALYLHALNAMNTFERPEEPYAKMIFGFRAERTLLPGNR